MKRIIFSSLLAVSMVPALHAAPDTSYELDGDYSAPPLVAPTIDATNVTFNASLTVNNTGAVFKTRDTLNFTNTQSGTLSAGFGFDFEWYPTVGTSGPKTASTFYNGGVINGGASVTISATNVALPGSIFIPVGSKIKVTGSSLDLSGTTLVLDVPGTNSFNVLDYGSGICPLSNTVAYAWDPSLNLTANSAFSSIFTNHLKQQLELGLIGSTPYFTSNFPTPTNQVIRAVFLENDNPLLATRVFIDSSDIAGGFAHIEWAGSQIDPVSGNTVSNYLYLSDVLADTTNAFTVFPFGYSISEQFGSPANVGTATPSGLPPFEPGTVTNSYAYIDYNVIPGSADTNNIVNLSPTNLPGRMTISASKDLDLALAQIEAPNYLLLESTNHFKGNNGSTIAAAYADIRLGSTNGFMTISNLWVPNQPRWNGPVIAWNTRWFTVNTNGPPIGTNTTASTITNDYRVLLVFSSLNAFAPTYVQDLWLHATNTLLISDTFNIFRSLWIDARSLTITTNGPGVGAGAVDGELNLRSPSLSWATSVPRLRYLTNNGAIRIWNASAQNFGSGLVGSNYLDFINTGFIGDNGSTIFANEFFNSGTISNGGNLFMLTSSNTTVLAGQILAGADATIRAQNLIVSNSFFNVKSLTLTPTNLLTDVSVTNGNFWSVGNTNGTTGVGFALTRKPLTGDLLGTSLTNYVGSGNKQAFNTWAGQDRGASVLGYSNNAALGRLILDTSGGSSVFNFGSAVPGLTNALYVDYLELRNAATNRDQTTNGNFTHLVLTNNLIIYYAQAIIDGTSIAEKMNHKNNDHLRWVPSYAGYFSSTNIGFSGVTNAYNAALAQSTDIDSDGDGIPNASDPTPFFLPSDVNLQTALTNVPPPSMRLTFNTIPHATNFVYYSTNMVNWLLLTNFVTVAPYPSPPVTVVVLDPIMAVTRFYQVTVNTWLTYPF